MSPFYLFIYLFTVFLRPHLQHMEVPRPGVETDLQLPAYITTTAKPDPSHICKAAPKLMTMPDP